MHRIDGPGAAPGGVFTEGDPSTGLPATHITGDWANAVQEEIVAVVAAGGLALNKPDNGQMVAAIRALIDAVAPVGEVIFGYFDAAPSGCLLLHGGLINRAAYPRLVAYVIARGWVVSEAAWAANSWGFFGAGDGSTTLRLPDVRGEFPRFADAGRGVDAGRTVGTAQADAMQRVTGVLSVVNGGVAVASGAFAADSTASAHINSGVTGTDPGVSFDNARVARTATETRPRSIAFTGCIRY